MIHRGASLFLGVALTVSMGCGGSPNTREKEGMAVAAVAGAASIVRLARSQSPPAKKSADECCRVCDRCSFPCGDACVPLGSLCMKPVGCACYQAQLPASERPAETYEPSSCFANEPGEPMHIPPTPMVPIIRY